MHTWIPSINMTDRLSELPSTVYCRPWWNGQNGPWNRRWGNKHVTSSVQWPGYGLDDRRIRIRFPVESRHSSTALTANRLRVPPRSQIQIIFQTWSTWRTPKSRPLLGRLLAPQTVRKFSAIYVTRKFTMAFTKARQMSLSWARVIQSKPPLPLPHPIYQRPNISAQVWNCVFRFITCCFFDVILTVHRR